jgi:hypothetical protein
VNAAYLFLRCLCKTLSSYEDEKRDGFCENNPKFHLLTNFLGRGAGNLKNNDTFKYTLYVNAATYPNKYWKEACIS